MGLEEILFLRFAHRMLEPAWDSNHIAVCRYSSAAPKPAGARALIARGRPEDLDRAQHMLEQAEETAERLDGGLVTREVAECRAALAAMSK
jgi:hypothetical protein